MFFDRAGLALGFRRFGASEFESLRSLEFEDAGRFLEPLPLILDLVRRGSSHSLVAIEAGGRVAGFYVVHPDRRDGSCWWLGWLAVDRLRQGCGLGRAALASALARLARIGRCRRVRLLVAAENGVALGLYRRAGFRAVGVWAPTGEMVMEREQHGGKLAGPRVPGVVVPALTLVLAMALRLWRRGVPMAARMSGEFHGPPGPAFATSVLWLKARRVPQQFAGSWSCAVCAAPG